jgi:hypothetical protein
LPPEKIDREKFKELVEEALPLWEEYLEFEQDLAKVYNFIPDVGPNKVDLGPVFNHLDHYEAYKEKEKDLATSAEELNKLAVQMVELGIESRSHFLLEWKDKRFVMSIYESEVQPYGVSLHFLELLNPEPEEEAQ